MNNCPIDKGVTPFNEKNDENITDEINIMHEDLYNNNYFDIEDDFLEEYNRKTELEYMIEKEHTQALTVGNEDGEIIFDFDKMYAEFYAASCSDAENLPTEESNKPSEPLFLPDEDTFFY